MFRLRTRQLFVAFVLCDPGILAQGAGDPERQAMYRRYAEFASSLHSGFVEAHWMADGSSFWYVEGAPANTIIWTVDSIANTKAPLFDVGRLRRALAAALGHEPSSKGLPFSDFVFLDGETAVVLPDQPHVPTGNSWTYMRDRIARYLQEHLKTARDN